MAQFIFSIFVAIVVFMAIFATAIPDVDDENFTCPTDLSIFRSSSIISSFDAKKLSGMWYEIAYHDAAQIGETCQSYNRMVSDDGQSMEEHFGFTYPDHKPSSLKLQIDFDSTNRGVYQRYINAPIVRNMKFPSVVVDATLSKDRSTYETVSEFLCYKIGPVSYREIRIGARTPTISDAQLLLLEENMKKLGVPFNLLRKAEQQSNCTYVQ